MFEIYFRKSLIKFQVCIKNYNIFSFYTAYVKNNWIFPLYTFQVNKTHTSKGDTLRKMDTGLGMIF